MRPFGLLIVFASLLAPLLMFWPLAAKYDPAAVFSQYIGVVALIAMGLCQLLATRWRGLETIFGGLDRMYVLHKWLGIGAMAAILVHDTIDAEIDALGKQTLLHDFGETLGEISLYGLLILVVLTIATFVPYHLWKYTHKLMGAFFAAGAIHTLAVMRPFQVTDPLGLYITFFCVLGIVCYLYTLMPYGMLQGRAKYKVSKVEPTGDAVAVTLAPKGRGIRHRAGQFAFVNFDVPGLDEVHPYTISNAPSDGTIRFTIKRLGDYTARLERTLKEGAGAKVTGAFGEFRRKKNKGTDVWIAGGIGITPFTAWAEGLKGDEGPIHLFHCVKNAASAPHCEALEKLAASHDNFTYHLVESNIRGRLTAREIADVTGVSGEQMKAYFCGPEAMRKSLMEGLRREGMRAAHFHYEEFEIRSGIGLRRLAKWLSPKMPEPLGSVMRVVGS